MVVVLAKAKVAEDLFAVRSELLVADLGERVQTVRVLGVEGTCAATDACVQVEQPMEPPLEVIVVAERVREVDSSSPEMPSRFADLVTKFQAGAVGNSVHDLRLAGQTVDAVERALAGLGFRKQRTPLMAERTRTGAPRWRLLDGGTSTDPAHPAVVPVDVHVHLDGGCVRIHPLGDPRHPLDPITPFAAKSVLFVAPSWRVDDLAGKRALEIDTSFCNEAFRVTDEGAVVAKSRRTAYGAPGIARDALANYRVAEAAFRRSFVWLAPPPPPAERLPPRAPR